MANEDDIPFEVGKEMFKGLVNDRVAKAGAAYVAAETARALAAAPVQAVARRAAGEAASVALMQASKTAAVNVAAAKAASACIGQVGSLLIDPVAAMVKAKRDNPDATGSDVAWAGGKGLVTGGAQAVVTIGFLLLIPGPGWVAAAAGIGANLAAKKLVK
ncbi:hypothetical protein [Actinoplanes sp. NPDC026619]|uniref:hypothetical protein n=1 Tax=Actinoplanes sp. NPDC026619 TaxID=3155798 RepID=UPI0033D9FDF9